MNNLLFRSYLVCCLINMILGFILGLESVQKTLLYATGIAFMIVFIIFPLIQWKLIISDITAKITNLKKVFCIIILCLSSIVGMDLSFLIFNPTFGNQYLISRLVLLGVALFISLLGLRIKQSKHHQNTY
jgi:hypothetical protein